MMLEDLYPPLNRIVDVNVTLFQWPFRRLPFDSTQKLVSHLKSRNVQTALAGSFEAILHRDIAAVNRRLVAECSEYGEGILHPVGAVNPTLLHWEDDLAYCGEHDDIRAVRIYPGYHRFDFDHEAFAELLKRCSNLQLPLQIVIRMEDQRTEHPDFIWETPDYQLLAEQLSRIPEVCVMLLNPGRDITAATVSRFSPFENVYFDLSMIEGVGGIEKYMKSIPAKRMLFGSNFPLNYFEAAELKLMENELGNEITRMICWKNASDHVLRTGNNSR